MQVKLKTNDFIVFDLDDTLYKEIDYLKSAYRFISAQLKTETGKDIYEEMFELRTSGAVVFDVILEKYNIQRFTVKDLIFLYRFHKPTLELSSGVKPILDLLKSKNIKMGIITDGRSLSQRNKLKDLDVIEYFDKIIISEELGSEKPNANNFLSYHIDYPEYEFTYIGDNFTKDFIAPKRLGWRTIGLLDNGQNIHPQDLKTQNEGLPEYFIKSFNELKVSFI